MVGNIGRKIVYCTEKESRHTVRRVIIGVVDYRRNSTVRTDRQYTEGYHTEKGNTVLKHCICTM